MSVLQSSPINYVIDGFATRLLCWIPCLGFLRSWPFGGSDCESTTRGTVCKQLSAILVGDPGCNLLVIVAELFGAFLKCLLDPLGIEIQVAMHQHVAEATEAG